MEAVTEFVQKKIEIEAKIQALKSKKATVLQEIQSLRNSIISELTALENEVVGLDITKTTPVETDTTPVETDTTSDISEVQMPEQISTEPPAQTPTHSEVLEVSYVDHH